MLTLFTVPKPFRGHIGIIQKNAIMSWLQLRPQCEIILFGDEEGTAETAASLCVRHVPELTRNEYGTPLLDHVFATAHQIASNNVMVYINSDIILMNDVLNAIHQVGLDRFLMIGRRWDLDITEPVNFDEPEWEAELREMIRTQGTLHSHLGVDYYIYTKGLFSNIPPFAIGRTTYDNWFIFKSRSMGVPVIDATRLITNIHQNHERTYASVGLVGPQGETDLRKGVESQRNLQLAGGPSHIFSLLYANWILTSRGLERALSPMHLYLQMRAFPALHPQFCFLLVTFNAIELIAKALRKLLRTLRSIAAK